MQAVAAEFPMAIPSVELRAKTRQQPLTAKRE